MDRIADAGVPGDAAVRVIDLTGTFEETDVFQQCPLTDRCKDLRFFFPAKVDALGVTASFKVKDAVIPPSVFIIPDQRAFRVGAEGGLARPAEAEEKCGVPGRSCVCGAVHA